MLLEPSKLEVFKLVLEDLVKPFRFVSGGDLCTGMTFDRKLYQLHQSFQAQKRHQALEQATALTEQGIPVVVTVSPKTNFYQIWVDLRFAAHRVLTTSNATQV
ncbi:MAG TPA: hypothetical protein V6C65_04950 [Allocoleopsis sp.]